MKLPHPLHSIFIQKFLWRSMWLHFSR